MRHHRLLLPATAAAALLLASSVAASRRSGAVHPSRAAAAALLDGVNFPYESIQLTDHDIGNFSALSFGKISSPGASSLSTVCKAFPGTPDWPSPQAWARLNATLDGALLHPDPPGAVCYPGRPDVYNATRCYQLLFNAFGSRFYIDDPLTVLTAWPQGETCAAAFRPTSNCTRGGFPEYVVNVSTVRDVQAAVNFARNTHVRLVVKNTGHDFVGRSTGAGALSVWTHHLKEFAYLPHYVSNASSFPYTGPAARVGAGLEAWELYQYMDRYNMTLIVPGGQTVGAFGGWMAGGGHSALASSYGMGSDQVLSLQVVTADGHFQTIDPDTNPDLFYALRGGGPGSYGIVTSAVVRAFPAVHVAESRISFQVGGGGGGGGFGGFNFSGFPPLNLTNGTYPAPFPFAPTNGSSNPFFNETNPFNVTGSAPFFNTSAFPPFNASGFSLPMPPATARNVDTFWQAVAAYFRFGQQLCDGGGSGYSYISQLGNGSYSFSTTLELPGMTDRDAQTFLQPVFDDLNALGVVVNNTMPRTSVSWGPGAQQGAGDSPGNGRFATRLFPRRNWEDPATFNATMAALRSVIESGYSFHGVQVAPSLNLPAVQFPGNSSVNPAFRAALLHGDFFDYGDLGGRPRGGSGRGGTSYNATAAVLASRARFEAAMDTLRRVTPGSGAYINEADPDEPNWQQSFFGSEYPRLSMIKRRLDPWDVFWSPKTVGSERWEVRAEDSTYAGTQNGVLCRAGSRGGSSSEKKGRSSLDQKPYAGPRHH